MALGCLRDIRADDGKIAVGQLQHVRAMKRLRAATGRAGSSKAAQEHAAKLTIVRCSVNRILGYAIAVPSATHRERLCAEVARLLRAARERQGLSMTAVAVKSGLSQQMVSYVERGMRNPTLDTLLRMTEALDEDLSALLAQAVVHVGPKPTRRRP